MIRVTSAGHSDVGRVRDLNEDAFHVGDSVFAVADGMGGHLAGEIASMTALEPIAQLDGRVFPDAANALTALRDAVTSANQAVVSKAAGDPAFTGMGTTLTAVMVEGRRAHVAHVGDSRAYLLRGGQFSQLTTDHTLVQRLIDEGRLTPEEAAAHPQRSMVTRAIGVEDEVEVDAMSLEVEGGDQLLLCSDGLNGPVDDEVIGRLLAGHADAEAAVHALVDAANANGGPDNVTAVLLRFESLDDDEPAPRATVSVRTLSSSEGGDWAERLGRLGTPGVADHRPELRRSKRQRMAAIVIAIGIVTGAVLAGGRWLLSRSYYVGAEDGEVFIYQGVPVDLGPLDLSWRHEPTGLRLDDIPPIFRDDVLAGVTATDLADARRIVANYREDPDADGTP